MEKPIITVENLGKAYQLGLKEEKYPTFREALVGAAKAPLRRLRHLSGQAQLEEERFWALKDVSFEVKRGEVVGIIGRNGAGKSTLLKILSRITEPTTGRAVLRGRVASLLEVGTGFHPELAGRENIYLNGSILGMKRREIDRKFDEIVAFAEVEKFLDTPVKHYSSGMYVRLAFAVAAHLEPEILIVDEVLAVGDAEFQRKCLGKMHEVAQGQGRTVLFVSHNMAAARALCDVGVLLRGGRKVFEGPAGQCIEEYVSQISVPKRALFRDRIDLSGNERRQIIDFSITGGTAAEPGVLHTGGAACIRICVNSADHGLNCAFTIYDLHGGPIATFDTSSGRSSLDESVENTREFMCEILELNLRPGEYRINVALLNGTELIDHVEDAAAVSVEPGKLRDRHISRLSGYGHVVFPHKWCRPV